MKLHISNSANRDATIVATSLPAKEGTIPAKAGKPAKKVGTTRVVKRGTTRKKK